MICSWSIVSLYNLTGYKNFLLLNAKKPTLSNKISLKKLFENDSFIAAKSLVLFLAISPI